ncbi:Brp/Blh family beta-carotene 15,15'-dioxygenase [Flavobacteriaceae bacterium]|mgnify:CR=1 FL=1|jgi:beta-carotene 15,15'-dioxygenase|nr:Brp/Blh family beta-carotene 15,15'-dioxygenase [Flavobacteriaceae bacterium]
MKKNYNFSIILSFVGLWITSFFSSEAEIILGFLLIFSFGILHGSNDLLLIHTFSKIPSRLMFLKILGLYIAIILLAVILFYFIPSIALLLFIIFSAFHFGEQHWESKQLHIPLRLRQSFYFFYGLLVLQILFVLNIEDVILTIDSITSHTIPETAINTILNINLVILLLLSFLIYRRSENFRKTAPLEIFYLLIFCIIFKVSTLIWGFTIYFILWHSIPSLHDQIKFIYGNYNKTNCLNYLRKAFPYWLVSIFGIALVYSLIKDQRIVNAILFSFIAAITFPHALVMSKMFSTNKKRT